MKLIETLPHYLIQVRFQDNEIQIYDIISKKVVASEPYNKKIVAFRKVEHQIYLALNEKDEIVSEISISIKLISKISEFQTGAGYILDFHMLSQSHGFYFGYYEMGEFKLTKDGKLVKIRPYSVHNCTKGRVNKSSNVYLGCRENDEYFLVKLNWKSNTDPEILWKKAIPSAVMAMEIIGDRLFIGLKNGSLQLWDIQKDECIKTIKLFSSTFSVSTVKGENITLASKNGDVARISKNGKIQWKTKITSEKIVGIYEDKDYVLVINTIGEQFHIKFESGKVIKHRYSNLKLGKNAGLSSSIIKYRKRFIITGYGGIWAFRHRNFNNSIHQYMSDPLMRIIHQHPFGFYSGDDNESVCFWGLGDIKIKVENYKPPLKNNKEYIKLKSKSLYSLKKIKGRDNSYSMSDFKSKKKKNSSKKVKKKKQKTKNKKLDDDTIKIIVFGDESVNKTSLIIKYISGFFLDDLKLTIGVDFYSKTINFNGKKLKLQIWDFEGQERFRFLLHQYCKGARGGLFVCNIADSSSFVHIDYWLSSVRKKNRAKDLFPILVVGILPDESEERQITTEEGTKLAESRNLNGYIECSPKTGENVDKVFEDLTRLMLAHKDCRPPQKRDEALPLNKDNLKENKTLETEKQLLDAERLRLEQEVNSLRNEKGVDSSVRLKFIGAKMSSPKAPFIPPLHPPLPSKSYRDQIINLLLSKIQRFWQLQSSRIISLTLVQGRDTILYNKFDSWDISVALRSVLSSWNSLTAQFIMISGIKYTVLQCTFDILVASSLKGKDHILIAKEEDYTLILHVEPDSGSMGNLDRGPPRDPGSASEAALVDF